MVNFDDLKLSVEAMSGGKNTVLLDDLGMPSIVVVVPKFKLSDVIAGAPQETHPAFVVDGEEKDFIYISKYQNIVMNDRAYSLPMKDPATYLNFDRAVEVCRNKGKGWHLMTNAEWAAIALWCKKNNTVPRGNNSYGQDYSMTLEKGAPTLVGSDGRPNRIATGSGPNTWAHNHCNDGIFDLNGNVWEWNGGLRLKNGEIQIIPYNDAAKDISQSDTSTLWKAILQDGTFVAPGTANTLKIDSSVVGSSEQASPGIGAPIISTTRQYPAHTGGDVNDHYQYNHTIFQTLAAKSGVTIPMVLKSLGIAPVDASCNDDGFWARNYGERLCLRGGNWSDGSGSGVFALNLSNHRSNSGGHIGFRSAFVNL